MNREENKRAENKRRKQDNGMHKSIKISRDSRKINPTALLRVVLFFSSIPDG